MSNKQDNEKHAFLKIIPNQLSLIFIFLKLVSYSGVLVLYELQLHDHNNNKKLQSTLLIEKWDHF